MSSETPMAGDFLSLLAAQKLAPWRAEVSSAAPPQTQATTVFAFHFAEGVLMAGDRRATAGNVIVTDRVDKVIEIDGSSLLAIAGVPATAFEMARILQTSFEYYRRSQLQTLSLPARVRALARLLRDNLAMTMQGVGIVAPDLFDGVDAVAFAEPKIHQRDVRSMPLEFGHRFIGVGSACHHLDIRFAREDQRNSFADDSMIVHAEHSDRRRGRHMAAGKLFLSWPDRGMAASIAVPRPADEVMVSVPPSSSARSLIVVRP